MKRLLVNLFVTLLFCSVTIPLSAQFSGSGSGTADDPYRIYNAVQLNQVRNFLNEEDVYFSLEADIDMTDWIAENNPVQGWQPIGNSSSAFKGVFNGNGHIISNLWINRPDTDYIGLFGYVSDGNVYLRVKFSCDGRKIAKSEGGHDLVVMCDFSYSLDGKKYKKLGKSFQAREGKWIGTKVGMFCTRPAIKANDGGWTDVDWFRITK